MRFALLGCDDDMARLVARAVSDRKHSVVAVRVEPIWRERLAATLPNCEWLDGWESLMAEDRVDAVLVGHDRVAGDGTEALKKLVQAGVPILATHPLGDPLLALELEMIRGDGRGPIVAHYPGCRHPAIAQLAQWVRSGDASPLGRIEQVVFERALANRDRAAVTAQLARDADLLRELLGKVTQVNAMGPSPDAEMWNNLSVQLAGRTSGGNGSTAGLDGPLARWSVEPVVGVPMGKLTLIGGRGRATLTMPANPAAWSLDTSGSNAPSEMLGVCSWPDWDGDAAALDMLARAVSDGVAVVPTWPAICRDLEVADTVELSLRRGRLIELHHDTVTEEDTFKGVMSAVGCLLLLIVPLVLLAAAILDGLTVASRGVSATGAAGDSGVTGRPWWPFFLVAPLIVFLLLQALRVVARRSPRQATAVRSD